MFTADWFEVTSILKHSETPYLAQLGRMAVCGGLVGVCCAAHV